MNSLLNSWHPRLVALANAAQGIDGAHDTNHLHRVWRNASLLLDDYPEADPLITRTKERVQLKSAEVPSLLALPPGCSFHPRCPYVQPSHTEIDPRIDTGKVNIPPMIIQIPVENAIKHGLRPKSGQKIP